jgi:hypothetical protein
LTIIWISIIIKTVEEAQKHRGEPKMTTTETKAKNANDVASLFFAQKIVEQVERVQRWVEDVQEKVTQGRESYYNLYLHETCNLGLVHVTISRTQGAWIYKLTHRRGAKSEGVLSFEGDVVGTWQYLESVNGDPYERMHFTVDVSFIREYMKVDSGVLALVAQQIGE